MTFAQLAPFLQEYIYHQGWTELRPAQLEACEVIFTTNQHLLVAAGTAAGKTEAAFLPVITKLHESPPQTIGVIYISPIKALINNQFDRLNDLLQYADIQVCAWHGDTNQNNKKNLLKNPQGILQITPESLESLLINKYQQIPNLFHDLQFVIIDEIHAFMGTQRGSQILCQLARLEKFIAHPLRRIGLSATLGDYAQAEDWLRSGSDLAVRTTNITNTSRRIQLAVDYFVTPESDAEDSHNLSHYQHIFQQTQAKKSLIFTNNRTQAEQVISNLRRIALEQDSPDVYHVHHGSISPNLRQDAETAMQDPKSLAVTAATVSLEMGIDIGQLDQVIQLESPSSVASFLQRLGRSGRRGSPSRMQFICTAPELLGEEYFSVQIPWQFLQTIAILQLYLEERWIEPIAPLQYPLSLFYQQILSIVAATGEITPHNLAQTILNMAPFCQITTEELRQLLHYLISLEHLEKTENNLLVLGEIGEKIVRSFQFYGVFAEQITYDVCHGGIAIGKVLIAPSIGSKITLAGKTWEVVEINPKTKAMEVKPIVGVGTVNWRGGSINIHTQVLQKMRQILQEDIIYRYLQPKAIARLSTARNLFKTMEGDQTTIFHLEKNSYAIFPWLGTRGYHTLVKVLHILKEGRVEIKKISGNQPYFLVVKLGRNSSIEQLATELITLCRSGITAEDLVTSDEEPQKLNKYDQFIPHNLLRKAYAHDYLDLSAVVDYSHILSKEMNKQI
jgi:ATP-dependent helicase Lhr and Lhr-like helicase